MFIAPKDHVFLQMDLSQAETWVSAHLAKEYTMIHALKEEDIHVVTAAFLFDIPKEKVGKKSIERYIGKKSNHSFTYRQGPDSFTDNFNKESVDLGISITLTQGKTYHSKWNMLYNLRPWWDEIENKLRKDRKLTTPYGRECTFFEGWGKLLFNTATAYVPQSTVADHSWGAIQPGVHDKPGGIRAISKFCKNNGFRFVHTAYDSIMTEIPNNLVDEIAPQIYNMFHRPLVINGEEFYIPVDCEYGERYGEWYKQESEQLTKRLQAA
jgi:hypothetical protein